MNRPILRWMLRYNEWLCASFIFYDKNCLQAYSYKTDFDPYFAIYTIRMNLSHLTNCKSLNEFLPDYQKWIASSMLILLHVHIYENFGDRISSITIDSVTYYLLIPHFFSMHFFLKLNFWSQTFYQGQSLYQIKFKLN